MRGLIRSNDLRLTNALARKSLFQSEKPWIGLLLAPLQQS